MPVSGNGTAVRGLGGPAGFGEIEVPRGDDNALQLDLSQVFGAGFDYFGTRYGAGALYVNTNGVLSFGSPFALYPVAENRMVAQDVIAPLWSDVDTRLDGEGTESGAIWVDMDAARDVVTVTWANVGAYRRNADDTNLFQVQLFDRGNGNFDIVLRYERIEWTRGTGELDDGGRALIAAERLPQPEWLSPYGSIAGLLTLPGTAGNTGVPGLWVYEMRGGAVAGLATIDGLTRTGTDRSDLLEGTALGDSLTALKGNDTLRGYAGSDHLRGGDGADTLNGGDGDDFIFGGDTAADLRDVIYGGAGNDRIAAGYGNDVVHGGTGHDEIEGGFGVDDLYGQEGDDTISGSALSDLIFGGGGNDFINGGFGFDRLNGGTGADRFFHLGVAGHGSDWIQDYTRAEGDVLAFGLAATSSLLFQVNLALTPNAGQADIEEAFVIYRPTGQILWALVDGAAQGSLSLLLSGQAYDLAV